MKNMKHFCKRGISLALALMMCLSLLPVTAFAEGVDEHDHDHDVVELVETEPVEEAQADADAEPAEEVEADADAEPVAQSPLEAVAEAVSTLGAPAATLATEHSDKCPDGSEHSSAHERGTTYCTNCGAIYVAFAGWEVGTGCDNSKIGHNADNDICGTWVHLSDATCGEAAKEHRTCKWCGMEVTRSVGKPTDRHTWTEATCTAPKTCSTCGATEGTKNANNHAATCTVEGWIEVNGEHIQKRACGAEVDRHVPEAECLDTTCACGLTVTVTGHSYGDWGPAADSACDGKVKQTRTCENCAATEEREVDATGVHSYANATCGSNGVCSVCGDTNGPKAETHSGTTTWKLEDGMHVEYCDTCGQATGEKHEAPVATCKGETECDDCDLTVPAAEHKNLTYTYNTQKGATHVITCNDCHQPLSTENHTNNGGACTKCGRVIGTIKTVYSYENGSRISTGTNNGRLLGFVGNTVSGADLAGGFINGGDGYTYEFVSSNPESLTLTEGGTYTITLKFVHKHVDNNKDGYCDECKKNCCKHEGPLEHTPAVAATCLTDGNIEYWTCPVCKRNFKDAAGKTTAEDSDIKKPAHGHWLKTHVKAKDPTCTEDGNVEYWQCNYSDCGWYFLNSRAQFSKDHVDAKELVKPATGHELTETKAEAATCTDEGNIEYWHCNDCGKDFSDEAGTIELTAVIIPSSGHRMGDWFVDEMPTADEDGLAKRTCGNDNCVYEETKALPALGTDPVGNGYTVTKVATCTAPGEATYDVGEGLTVTVTVTIPKLPHDLRNVSKVDATCLSTGVQKHSVCRICGTIVRRDGREGTSLEELGLILQINKTNHVGEPSEWVAVEGGKHEKYYATCGHVAESDVHSYGNWYRNAETGEIERVCGVCDDVEVFVPTEEKPIPTEEHNCDKLVEVDGYNATCTTAGLTDGTQCSICSEVTSGLEPIPATGHSYGEWFAVIDPTETDAGMDARYCENPGCGDFELRAVAALGTGEVEIDEPDTPLAGLPFDLDPEEELTRGHLMYILYWFEGEPDAAACTFTDAYAEAYYYEALGWAEENGIAVAYPDGTFKPEETVTRGDMEIFLNRYNQYLEVEEEITLAGDREHKMLWGEAEVILNDFFSIPVLF